jgi:hypothetical protein
VGTSPRILEGKINHCDHGEVKTLSGVRSQHEPENNDKAVSCQEATGEKYISEGL